MAHTQHRECLNCPHKRIRYLRGRQGITLTELLTAVGIIVVLAAIILSTTTRLLESATGVSCLSNLRSIGAGVKLHEIDHRDRDNSLILDYRFHVQLWPYIYPERTDVAVLVTGDPPPLFKGTVFECPSVYDDKVTPRRSYGINSNLASRFSWADPKISERRLIPEAMIDVAPDTALIGEVGGGTSATSYLRPDTAHARHRKRMNVVYCDGRVDPLTLTPELRIRPSNLSFWSGQTP